jgi:DNA-binding transcriptional regulator YiaG
MCAEEVKLLRSKLDLSQSELGSALGVQGRLTVFRWEAGHRMPSKTIKRIVRLLNSLSKKDALKLLNQIEQCGEENDD